MIGRIEPTRSTAWRTIMTRKLCPLVLVFVGLLSAPAGSAEIADVIYHGGDILTVDDKNPKVGAVAIRGGLIVAVGTTADVFKLKGDSTQPIDLNGKTLAPGFIDAHGHLMGVGLQRSVSNLLPPPEGTVSSIAQLQAMLKQWAASDSARRIDGGKLVVGFGYDESQLTERRAPTRQELDAV